MFIFPLSRLESISGLNLDINEVTEILNLQGIDVKDVAMSPIHSEYLVTIDVKANRGDVLNFVGILREILLFKGYKQKEIIDKYYHRWIDTLEDSNSDFCLTLIENIDINRDFSEKYRYIPETLDILGVNRINTVVDILNYMTIEYGQPFHVYDARKTQYEDIRVEQTKNIEKDLETINGEKIDISIDSILIRDKKKILSVAGIIGGKSSMVDSNTKSVILEVVNFDKNKIRRTARQMKISTLSSYRFERGIDETQIENAKRIITAMMIDICGGYIQIDTNNRNKNEQSKREIEISVERTNIKIGMTISKEEIIVRLERYDFLIYPINSSFDVPPLDVFRSKKVETEDRIEEDLIAVTPPSYRYDIEIEEDVIEEIARIGGYYNIPMTPPCISMKSVDGNRTTRRFHIYNDIRKILVNRGLNEVVNYTFVSKQFGEVEIKNPLSSEYSYMRNGLIYSLSNSLAYNYSVGNKNIGGLFEIGKIFNKDGEKYILGIVFTGIRLEAGFGIQRNIMYESSDIYDFLNTLLLEYYGQKFRIELPESINEWKYRILLEDSERLSVGFCGTVNKDILNMIQNSKLINTDIMYIELELEKIEKKHRFVRTISEFPSVIREYNLLLVEDKPISLILEIVDKYREQLIEEVSVRDIYVGKGIPEGKRSVLIKIQYLDRMSTIKTEDVERIEKLFLDELEMIGICIRQ